MTSDDYTPIVRGPLKLKGGGPIGISKKNKKSKKKNNLNQTQISSIDGEIMSNQIPSSAGSSMATTTTTTITMSTSDTMGLEEKTEKKKDNNKNKIKGGELSSLSPQAEDQDQELGEIGNGGPSNKTVSERAYEERRKRMLLDRLAKEGLKTHKQRVEELNKYLSNLSEHHDMPRIGPG